MPMNDVTNLVLDHLRTPQGYDGVRSIEAMAEESGIPRDKIIRLNGNENSYGPSRRKLKPQVVSAYDD